MKHKLLHDLCNYAITGGAAYEIIKDLMRIKTGIKHDNIKKAASL